MQTDPIGYDDQINLYAYVGDDPVNKIDETGRWSKNVHNKIFDMAVGKKVNATQLQYIKGASLRQDMPWGNGSHNEMHFLRDPKERPKDAKAAFTSYVNGQIKEAKDLEKQGNHVGALGAFGRAAHAIADSFSPAHNEKGNPAVYDPKWGPVDAARHGHSPLDSVGLEGTDDLTPSTQREIVKQTSQLYDSIFKKEAPVCHVGQTGGLKCI
jgi:hypothetical protein